MRPLALLVILALTPRVATQPDPRPPEPRHGIAAVAARIPDLLRRLEALAPEDPEAYFLLAEEVASESADAQGDLLARQLYIQAFIHDRAGAGPGLRAGACLGLAALERVEETRLWLVATSQRIDARYAQTDWSALEEAPVTDDAALKAASVLGLIRAGEGLRALALMDEPPVRATLLRYERLLGQTGLTGGFDRLVQHARAWPCPECGNKRLVTRNTPAGPESRLCNTCQGDPGPRLSDAEFLTHLRFESRLLSGIQRSWSAQVAADAGAPLLDPDPDELPGILKTRYGVEPEKPYFRSSRWVAEP